MTLAPKEETLEQIAERIAKKYVEGGFMLRMRLADCAAEILSVLRNEREARDERAVRLIDEHRAMDVCDENCWTAIKEAIRGRE